jgi:hypothetical protein
MQLTPKTKIEELLTNYPFLKDFLIKTNPNFKALDNPLIRKTLGRIATLSKAAMIGGMDLDQLMQAVAQEIEKQTGQKVGVDTGQEGAKEKDSEERVTILKGIIKDLHRGEDLQVLKQRFLELVKDVAPSEIAQMEQQLISEGMPEEEVKRLCDVHVEVFKESLEEKTVPGLPAGHPVHTFMLENRRAETLVRQMQALHDIAAEKGALISLLEQLSPLHVHYLRKENQLFPILEARGISGPSKVMWALDDDIRALLKEVTEKTRAGTVTLDLLKNLIQMVNDMIYKEEHILFPMALETLVEEEWQKVKHGEEEIGFAWLDSVESWSPSGEAYQETLPKEKVGSLALDTGMLTPEQINLLLTHLPVDISFVDENDKVAYYSATEDRIFPRSPGVIGREVRNCHPPKSVQVVEKILQEFKVGKKDVAEFHIQLKGRFIHIRYFAMRDGKGRYKGTLEVSQDITTLKRLEGEKRLLDWE